MIQADTLKGIEYYQQNIANAEHHKLNKELAQGYITMALIYSASMQRRRLNTITTRCALHAKRMTTRQPL
jgi:hypothetical protein